MQLCVCVCVSTYETAHYTRFFLLDVCVCVYGMVGCLVTERLYVAGKRLPPDSSVAEQRHTLTALKTAGAVARRSYSGCLATESSLFQSCLRTFSVLVSPLPAQ